MKRLLQALLGKKPLTGEDYLWHPRRSPLIPVRLTDGTLSDASSLGQLWRRRTRDGRWEFRQEEETADQYDARQW